MRQIFFRLVGLSALFAVQAVSAQLAPPPGCPEVRSQCSADTLRAAPQPQARANVNVHAYSKLLFKQVLFYSMREPNLPFKLTDTFDDMFKDHIGNGWVGGTVGIALHHKRTAGQWSVGWTEVYADRPPPLYVYGMTPFDDDEHAEMVAQDLMKSYATPRAILFAHGYRTSFEDAARAVSVLHADSASLGVPVLVSWPSRNTGWPTPDEYRAAQSNARTTSDFLAGLWPHLTEVGFSRIDVIAHSMGADVIVGSLEKIVSQYGGRPAMLGHLIFAAGDVEVGRASVLFRGVLASGDRRIVSYCSTYDVPLALSRRVNADRRLGECHDSDQLGVEKVKLARGYRRQDTLRHSFLFYEPSILDDIGKVLRTGQSSERRGLMSEGKMWVLRGRSGNARNE